MRLNAPRGIDTSEHFDVLSEGCIVSVLCSLWGFLVSAAIDRTFRGFAILKAVVTNRTSVARAGR